MKNRRWTPALPLLSALALGGSMPSATAGTPEERMTQGKLAADLGDHRAAERVFAAVGADAAAPETVRSEALVRLGVVQRSLGKTQASTATFQRAMASPGRDAQVTRLLALAVAGVAPDRARWADVWPKVQLSTRPGAAGSPLSVQWPGPGVAGVREAFPARDPVTFDLEDVALTDFLYKLLTGTPPGRAMIPPGFENWPESYQPPAAVQRMEFVIPSAALPDLRVTVKASSMPWNELFENVLAGSGLGFVLQDNLLFIARDEDLGAIERIRGRVYGGAPVSFVFLTREIADVFRLLSDITGFKLVPAANVQAIFGLRVVKRPSMQVLDLLLASNGLAATRTAAAPDAPPGTTALLISKLADVKGDPVELSRLVQASPHPH